MPIEEVEATALEVEASGLKARREININRKSADAHRKKRRYYEEPLRFDNVLHKVNWLNTTLILWIPLFTCLFVPFVPLKRKTLIWALIYYAISGLGITAGYHRLFAHRSYEASFPLQFILMCAGSAAGQGSVKWWSNGHRTHHRFCDTERDPYNAKRGFFYSHMGWMIFKQNPELKGRTDISDLISDPLVRFQHKHYIYFLLIFSYLLPAAVAGLGWGDWAGGIVYAAILRLFLVHQATFCVNSLAHWIGEQPFDDKRTPRDHVLTALVTLGEGYHNFHHEFPSDYRNALKWYQYDPTKLIIMLFHQMGLAFGLQRFSQNAIEQGMVQQQQKKLDRWRARLNWGVPIDKLPVIEFDDFQDQAKTRDLVVISGIVHDVTDFVEHHPGGRALIRSAIGKDATGVFNGGVYQHSNAAHNLVANMRVAVVRGGCEVDVWKKAHSERKDARILESDGQKIVRAGEQPSATHVVSSVPSA